MAESLSKDKEEKELCSTVLYKAPGGASQVLTTFKNYK